MTLVTRQLLTYWIDSETTHVGTFYFLDLPWRDPSNSPAGGTLIALWRTAVMQLWRDAKKLRMLNKLFTHNWNLEVFFGHHW